MDIQKPSLQQDIRCTHLASCTGVECCVDVKTINHSINVVLDLDPCNHRLIIGIENLSETISLYNLKMGMLLILTKYHYTVQVRCLEVYGTEDFSSKYRVTYR